MNTLPTSQPLVPFKGQGTLIRKDKEFEICALERMEHGRLLESDKHHRLHCFEIIWIKTGSGTLLVDLQTYNIHDQAIYFLAPASFANSISIGNCEAIISPYPLNFCTDRKSDRLFIISAAIWRQMATAYDAY